MSGRFACLLKPVRVNIPNLRSDVGLFVGHLLKASVFGKWEEWEGMLQCKLWLTAESKKRFGVYGT